MAESAFNMLSRELQQWIYQRGWSSLNELQEKAVAPIMEHKDDIVLSAATASGKTEAAFLPAISYIQKHPAPGLRILYVSPLKALINDQYKRLELMCAKTKVKVTPWHGDVSASKKNRLIRSPKGVVLITPESLESLLINNLQMLQSCVNLDYIIIDEFHAFMGTQRGCQLISQLHRLDNITRHHIVRIALSGTFSNISDVKDYLRPNTPQVTCRIIKPEGMNQDVLAVQLRGYSESAEVVKGRAVIRSACGQVANDIFRLMRGSNNLVFANSRSMTEDIASQLDEKSHTLHVPNEFFPHHGSLSKILRETLEHRLQEGRLPTTAICTSTLELGIDISDVESIGQIEPPTSVASLRQRLGRSGRRSRRAVLRLFVPEMDDHCADLSAQLAEKTFLSAAMVQLLLKRWYEPPMTHQYNFSVLVQQTLSVIASYGSASAQNIWNLLCRSGPFFMTDAATFATFLRSLASFGLITQMQDGTITLGVHGEALVSKWNFYAAFKSDDEYSIEFDHHEIGRVPLQRPPKIEETFVLAGKAWEVNFVSFESKIIGVKPYRQHAQPLIMGEGVGMIDDEVRAQMKALYSEGVCPAYLNKQAKDHFERGVLFFRHYDLEHRCLVEAPSCLALFPFMGSRACFTILQMLRHASILAEINNSHLELAYCSRENLKEAVDRILKRPPRKETELVRRIKNVEENKFDEYVCRELTELDYAQRNIDLKGALSFFKRLKQEL